MLLYADQFGAVDVSRGSAAPGRGQWKQSLAGPRCRLGKALALHLKDSIKHGNEAVYRPEIAVTWEVRAIVNG